MCRTEGVSGVKAADRRFPSTEVAYAAVYHRMGYCHAKPWASREWGTAQCCSTCRATCAPKVWTLSSRMDLASPKPTIDVDAFIERWSSGEGGQERANYALFLTELCGVLGVSRPDQASHDASANAYTFERAVTFRGPDGSKSPGRIDLYKRACFVLEAKQSRRPGAAKAVPMQGDLLSVVESEITLRGKRSVSRAWDVLMMQARQQAEDYAKALPTSEGWPPFLVVCDVGHCFEVFADFSGQGKNYAQFPDRQGFRIFLEDLRDDAIRARRLANCLRRRRPIGVRSSRRSSGRCSNKR
jgi:hypothetical protein